MTMPQTSWGRFYPYYAGEVVLFRLAMTPHHDGFAAEFLTFPGRSGAIRPHNSACIII
jgi:hypothetical protein